MNINSRRFVSIAAATLAVGGVVGIAAPCAAFAAEPASTTDQVQVQAVANGTFKFFNDKDVPLTLDIRSTAGNVYRQVDAHSNIEFGAGAGAYRITVSNFMEDIDFGMAAGQSGSGQWAGSSPTIQHNVIGTWSTDGSTATLRMH